MSVLCGGGMSSLRSSDLSFSSPKNPGAYVV